MNLRISELLAIAAFALMGVLASPQSIAQNAYITNEGNDTVSVVNTVRNTVIATIPVGQGPKGVAVTPDGSRVYIVSDTGSEFGIVSVIDTLANKVITTIPSVWSPRAWQ